MASEKQRWIPLENNPEVLNKYMNSLGFPTDSYQWMDVFSTEEWALDMIPHPVLALVMLYPIKEAQEKHREEEEKRIKENGQQVSDNIFFTKQTVGNACGTIGLLHAAINNSTLTGGPVELKNNSWFKNFVEKTRGKSAEERAESLEEDEELEESHGDAATEGQTEAVDEAVDTHFIAFVQKDGSMYELDGRKEFPVNHGPCTQEELLGKAATKMKEYMQRDPEEMRFTMLALAPNQGE